MNQEHQPPSERVVHQCHILAYLHTVVLSCTKVQTPTTVPLLKVTTPLPLTAVPQGITLPPLASIREHAQEVIGSYPLQLQSTLITLETAILNLMHHLMFHFSLTFLILLKTFNRKAASIMHRYAILLVYPYLNITCAPVIIHCNYPCSQRRLGSVHHLRKWGPQKIALKFTLRPLILPPPCE